MKRKTRSVRRLLLSLGLAAVLGLAFGATAWADGTLAPKAGATRAEIVVMLTRLIDELAK